MRQIRRSVPSLLGALLFLKFALITPLPLQAQGTPEDLRLSAPKALAAVRAGEMTLIDVRAPQEWRETGLPEGAQAVTIHDPEGLPAFVEKIKAVAAQNPDRPIAFICAAGVRSAYAHHLLTEAGLTQTYDVAEGMFGNRRDGPGWLKRGLPTEPCQSC